YGRVAKRMDRPAAAKDEDAFPAQGCDRFPEREVPLRVEMPLDRELDNRHTGLRVHQHEGHPGPVIESPARVAVTGNTSRFDKVRSPGGEFLRSGCGICYPVQVGREAPEVVDGLWVSGEVDRRSQGVPVRRDAEDCPDASIAFSECCEEFPGRLIPFERQGRRTVRDKNRGEDCRSHAFNWMSWNKGFGVGAMGGDHYPRSGPFHGRRRFSLSFLKNERVNCSSAFFRSLGTAGSSSGP